MCKAIIYHCQVYAMLKTTTINRGIWLFYQSCHRTSFLGRRNNEGEKDAIWGKWITEMKFHKTISPAFLLNCYHFKIYISPEKGVYFWKSFPSFLNVTFSYSTLQRAAAMLSLFSTSNCAALLVQHSEGALNLTRESSSFFLNLEEDFLRVRQLAFPLHPYHLSRLLKK